MESSATIEMHKPSQEIEAETKEVSNDEPEKKIIKLCKLTSNNLDPLEFFSRFLGIPEMILPHLRGKDLIKISEVSPSWYNFIGSSKVLMEKIKIVFNENRELHQDDYNLLMKSSRKYQSIEVGRSYDPRSAQSRITEFDCMSSPELAFFLIGARDWKNVSINEIYFERKRDLWNFLLSIESSVESLSITNRICAENPFKFDDESSLGFNALTFPKLKHLKMHFTNFSRMGIFYAIFLMESVAIETFEFKDSYEISTQRVLSNMLGKFVKLTNLTLQTNGSEGFQIHSFCLKRFKFKLRSLKIKEQERNYLNLKFIQSQSDHLEELRICLNHEKKIFDMILKMPKLKSLDIKYYKVYCPKDSPNEISSSITDLKLRYLSNVTTLKYLLKSMPNVTRINFYVYPDIFGTQCYQLLISCDEKYKKFKVGSCRWIDVDRKELDTFLVNWSDDCLVESFNE